MTTSKNEELLLCIFYRWSVKKISAFLISTLFMVTFLDVFSWNQIILSRSWHNTPTLPEIRLIPNSTHRHIDIPPDQLTNVPALRLQTVIDVIGDIKSKNLTFVNNKYTHNDIRGYQCVMYHKEISLKHFTVSNIWSTFAEYKENDVTLVSQFTLDKVTVLSELLDHWTAPISLALYIGYDILDKVPHVLERFPNILARENLDIHLVIKNGVCI